MALLIGPGATLATSSVPTTVVSNCAISCWIRSRQGANTNTATHIYVGNSGANGWGLCGFNSDYVGGLAGGVSYISGASLYLRKGYWQHVVFQRGATNWTFYRDNVASANQAVTPIAPATSLVINGGSGRDVFDLCDMAVWERTLSSQERVFLMNGGSPLHLSARPKWYVPALGGRYGSPDDFTDVISGNNLNVFAGSKLLVSHDDLPPEIQKFRGVSYELRNPRNRLPPATPPANTVAPVASGTPEVGSTLSVTNGTWTGFPVPTLTYQWQYNDGVWNNIIGATNSTWTVDVSGAVDVGDSIRCVVTGTNSGGTADANSNSLGPVTAIDFTNHYLGVSVS